MRIRRSGWRRTDPNLARAEAQIHRGQPREAVADYGRVLGIKLSRASNRCLAYAAAPMPGR